MSLNLCERLEEKTMSNPEITIIFIDTNLFIYATQDDKPQSVAAKQVLDRLQSEKNVRLGITMITLCELLIGIAPKDHQQFINDVEKNFIIANFNIEATKHTACVARDMYAKQKKNYQGERTALKADIKILGSILAYGANRLITEDKGLKELAKTYMTVSNLEDENKDYLL